MGVGTRLTRPERIAVILEAGFGTGFDTPSNRPIPISERCWATSPTALKEILSEGEQMGCDEVLLTPTSDSFDELSAAEDFVAGLN